MPDAQTQTEKLEEEKTMEEEKEEPQRQVRSVVPRSRGFVPRAVFGGPRLRCPSVTLFPTSSSDPVLDAIPEVYRRPPAQPRFRPCFPSTPPTPPPEPLPTTPDSLPSLVSTGSATSSPLPANAPILDLAEENPDRYGPTQWSLPPPGELSRQLRARFVRDFDPSPNEMSTRARQTLADAVTGRAPGPQPAAIPPYIPETHDFRRFPLRCGKRRNLIYFLFIFSSLIGVFDCFCFRFDVYD